MEEISAAVNTFRREVSAQLAGFSAIGSLIDTLASEEGMGLDERLKLIGVALDGLRGLMGTTLDGTTTMLSVLLKTIEVFDKRCELLEAK